MTTISYSRSFYHRFSFIVSYSHQGGCQLNNSVYASFIWSPKQDVTATVGFVQDEQQKGAAFSMSKNLPTDSGYGYRLLGNIGEKAFIEADFLAQNDHGLYQLMLSHIDGANNLEIDVSGSVVHFVGETFLTRKVENSFIVVEVPQIRDVPIYNSNQLITKTNVNGFAFLPQALPYDDNVISIHPTELPLNAKIERTHMHVSPYYRSGAYLQFPITMTRQFAFNLVTSDRENVPAGAMITLKQGMQYPVGYDGKVFISQVPDLDALSGIAQWNNQTCRFSSAWSDKDQAIIELGTLTCHPI